jgi:hypothetical protein
MTRTTRLTLLVAAAVALLPALAMANGRPDCMRNCETAQKGFEKQCKETARGDPQKKAGCDMVLKKLQSTCKQSCQRGEKMKKPANTNSF